MSPSLRDFSPLLSMSVCPNKSNAYCVGDGELAYMFVIAPLLNLKLQEQNQYERKGM